MSDKPSVPVASKTFLSYCIVMHRSAYLRCPLQPPTRIYRHSIIRQSAVGAFSSMWIRQTATNTHPHNWQCALANVRVNGWRICPSINRKNLSSMPFGIRNFYCNLSYWSKQTIDNYRPVCGYLQNAWEPNVSVASQHLPRPQNNIHGLVFSSNRESHNILCQWSTVSLASKPDSRAVSCANSLMAQ